MRFTHGRWWYSHLRPIGGYAMVVSIGLIALMILHQEPGAPAQPITSEQLRDSGRHAWFLILMHSAFGLGPIGLGLALTGLAYWLYRHFILLR